MKHRHSWSLVIALFFSAAMINEAASQVVIQLPWEGAEAKSIQKSCSRTWLKTSRGVLDEGPAYLIEGATARALPGKDVAVNKIQELAGRCWITTTRKVRTPGSWGKISSRGYLFNGQSAEPFGSSEQNIGAITELRGVVWLLSGVFSDPGRLYRFENNALQAVAANLGPTIVSLEESKGQIWLLTEASGSGRREKPGPAYRLDSDGPALVAPEDFNVLAVAELSDAVALIGQNSLGAGIFRPAGTNGEMMRLPGKSVNWAESSKSGLLISLKNSFDKFTLIAVSASGNSFRTVENVNTNVRLFCTCQGL